MLNFYMYENVWEHGQHTCQTSAAPPLTLTFSLVLSSSNISWISTRQSSCMLWKESWGMVAITASSMADSCSRMHEKDGRTWGSWSQHSGDTYESMNPPDRLTEPNIYVGICVTLPSMSLAKGSGQVEGIGRVNLLTATP